MAIVPLVGGVASTCFRAASAAGDNDMTVNPTPATRPLLTQRPSTDPFLLEPAQELVLLLLEILHAPSFVVCL